MFRYLSDAEFTTVLERAGEFRGQTGPAGRNAMAFILGLHGLRSAEIVNLLVGDIDLGTQGIDIKTVKRGVERRVFAEPSIMGWLLNLADGHGPRAPILRTCRGKPLLTRHVRRAWQRLSLRWIGREVRFHATRHTAAQRLFLATGKSLQKVQEFLGHKTLTSTLVYARDDGSVAQFMPRLPSEDKTFELRVYSEVG